mmetsp:Transcript_100625/g.313683  ORF Transcript_100625/g.313683 Transcript_100625/m.313683 type:complete len:491 (-) Transcript_100625:63-1535(-)
MKSWFVLDLGIVVMEWVVQFLDGIESASALGKISRAMRAVRLLRVAKLHTLLSEVNIKAKIRSELTRTLLGICRIICVILVLNHFMACGFYGLHYLNEDSENWVKKNFDPSDAVGYRYWTSVHWSLTQFTPASMEVVPVNTSERIYAVCALLLALICFSSFVSSITSAMTRYGNSNMRQQQQRAALYRFLGQRSISTELVNRVWHYLHDRSELASQVRTSEEDVELFAVLPESLKVDLRYEMYLPTIAGHPLFREYSQLEPQAVRHICKTAIKEHSMTMREELFGDCVDVTHMVFVTEGLLTYSYPVTEDKDEKWAQAEVGKGQWACEVALWASSLSLVGPFVAATSSELVLVSVAEFVVVARRFPTSIGVLAEYADSFVQHAQREAKDCKWLASLCNDTEVVQDLTQRALDDHVAAALDAMGRLDERSTVSTHRQTHHSGSSASSEAAAPKRGIWSMMTGSLPLRRESPKSGGGGRNPIDRTGTAPALF